MGLPGEVVELDDVKFQITLLPYEEGNKLLLSLTKAWGPVASKLTGASPLEALGGIDPEVTQNASRVLARYTFVLMSDGRSPKLCDVQDTVFRGKQGLWLKWIVAALRVNYADFLGAVSETLQSVFSKGAKR